MNTLISKIVWPLLAILLSASAWAVNIEPNGKYYIFHASGMALSAVDDVPNLHTFNGELAQQFQLQSSGNSYLIKSVSKGKFIGKTGDWNTELTSSTSSSTQFSVEPLGESYVKFRCAANNLYLGTDSNVPGASLYSDKSGQETLHCWYIKAVDGKTLITDGLMMTVEKAEARLSAVTRGDGLGQYSEESCDKFQKAIDVAKRVLDAPDSQSEISEATSTLANALTRFNGERNALSAGVKYYVVHASNRYLSNENGAVQLKNPSTDTKRQFIFESLTDGSYALKNVASNTYVTASGEYEVKMASNTASSATHFKVDFAPNEEFYVRFQCQSNSKYLGTDGTSDGKSVYSDKSGSDGKHYWRLVAVDEQVSHRKSFVIGSSAIRLGMNWNDEEGNHINAHGGCVLYEKGTYYWFGENYRPSPVKSNGIVCYSSKDLYNWKKEGMAYQCPEQPLRDDYQDMNYGRTLERPKVMYCPNTGKYVMWVHWENGSGYAASRVAILYADQITGPYRFVKTMRPRGDEQPSGSRDQTLLYDPDYQVGYHFGSAEENQTMHGTLLTDDYLDLSSTWERMFVKKQYEAPAIFKYHQRFVAITSGCTGWDPNAAHASYSQLPLSGWSDLGNPCVSSNANTTYNSQSNYIFKVPGKYDAYIYMGDRWKGGDYFNDANVGESWHIWLPIDMRTGYPIIRFYSAWDLSLFDRLNRYRRVAQVKEGGTYLLLSKNANKILSERAGEMRLMEDDEALNLSFRVTKTGDYYLLTDVSSGRALDATGGELALRDSSGAFEQQWRITLAGNDGYYYLSPRSAADMALTNFTASATFNGSAGLASANKELRCQFAFCFDSQKFDDEPISDESDGSYAKWMESKGYQRIPVEEVGVTPIASEPTVDIRIWIEKKRLFLSSDKAQRICVWRIDGTLFRTVELPSQEVVAVHLPQGVYVVEGRKCVVE